jgi:hypothetical protein
MSDISFVIYLVSTIALVDIDTDIDTDIDIDFRGLFVLLCSLLKIGLATAVAYCA